MPNTEKTNKAKQWLQDNDLYEDYIQKGYDKKMDELGYIKFLGYRETTTVQFYNLLEGCVLTFKNWDAVDKWQKQFNVSDAELEKNYNLIEQDVYEENI